MFGTKRLVAVFAAVLAVTSSGAQADDMEEMKKMLHQTCQGEIGADEALIARAQKGDFVDDAKLKDYMKCVFVQLAVLNDAGEFDFDMMSSLMPEELKAQGEKMVADCRGTTGATASDVAMNFNKCFFKSQPSIYFMV